MKCSCNDKVTHPRLLSRLSGTQGSVRAGVNIYHSTLVSIMFGRLTKVVERHINAYMNVGAFVSVSGARGRE